MSPSEMPKTEATESTVTPGGGVVAIDAHVRQGFRQEA
jgi:hypothetical protein